MNFLKKLTIANDKNLSSQVFDFQSDIVKKYQHLFIGNTLSSNLLIKFLFENSSNHEQTIGQTIGQTIAIIDDSYLSPNWTYYFQINLLRGNTNLSVWEKTIAAETEMGRPRSDIKTSVLLADGRIQERPSKYLKDNQLKTFANNLEKYTNKLSPIELFFAQPGYARISTGDDNPSEVDRLSAIDSLYENITTKLMIKSIEKLEDTSWLILGENGEKIFATNLYVSIGQDKFVQLLKNKSTFDENFLQLCKKNKRPLSVMVKIEHTGKFTNDIGTIILPKSTTSDAGHFIGEIHPFTKETKKHLAYFCWFPVEGEDSSEHISKNLRLLKRILLKLFSPYFSLSTYQESLFVGPLLTLPSSTDEDYNKFTNIYPNLFFLGMDAPIDLNFFQEMYPNTRALEVTGVSREIISYRQALKRISKLQ